MEDNEKLKLEVLFDSPNYGKVACEINIVDFGAVAKFSDVRLARQMFNEEKKQGNTNQKLIERLSCISEKFTAKKKEQIAKELVKKFEEHNIYVKEHA